MSRVREGRAATGGTAATEGPSQASDDRLRLAGMQRRWKERQSDGGRPLDGDTRQGLEQQFGEDFSGVRVHESEAARKHGAQAVTCGQDIHFAPGKLDSSSQQGRQLLAHELTHVVQQRGAAPAPQAKMEGVAKLQDDALESEADSVGDRVAAGEKVGVSGRAPHSAQMSPVDKSVDNPEAIREEAEEDKKEGKSMSPELADQMVTGTPVIGALVKQNYENGFSASGNTFFYHSEDAFIDGIVKHMGVQRANPISDDGHELTEEEIRAQFNSDAVAYTLIDADNTIHINLANGDREFRTILHELMHQQMAASHARGILPMMKEGSAELLSRVVLENYHVAYEEAGVDAGQLPLVNYLVEIFGRDEVIRACFQGDAELIAKFTPRAVLGKGETAVSAWKELGDKIYDGDFDGARAQLEKQYGNPESEELGKEEEQGAAETAAFDDKDEKDEAAREQEAERGTWKREGIEPVSGGRITGAKPLSGLPNVTTVTIDKGGNAGIREGWMVELGGEQYVVGRVMTHSCQILVPRPKDEIDREAKLTLFNTRTPTQMSLD